MFLQANYKIQAARLHYDIYALTQRLRHTTMRAEHEEQVRNFHFKLSGPLLLRSYVASRDPLRLLYTFWHLPPFLATCATDRRGKKRRRLQKKIFPLDLLVGLLFYRSPQRRRRWRKRGPISALSPLLRGFPFSLNEKSLNSLQ